MGIRAGLEASAAEPEAPRLRRCLNAPAHRRALEAQDGRPARDALAALGAAAPPRELAVRGHLEARRRARVGQVARKDEDAQVARVVAVAQRVPLESGRQRRLVVLVGPASLVARRARQLLVVPAGARVTIGHDAMIARAGAGVVKSDRCPSPGALWPVEAHMWSARPGQRPVRHRRRQARRRRWTSGCCSRTRSKRLLLRSSNPAGLCVKCQATWPPLFGRQPLTRPPIAARSLSIRWVGLSRPTTAIASRKQPGSPVA